MVPTTMFMGQVVTAFAPQQGQTQTISISQQPPQQQQQEQQQQHQQQQQQVTAMQPGQAPLAQQQTQFIQVTHQMLHIGGGWAIILSEWSHSVLDLDEWAGQVLQESNPALKKGSEVN